MKGKLYFIIGLFLIQLALQGQMDQKTNYIFLWDVTQSMKGLYHDKASGAYKTNSDNDIYDQVVSVISNIIETIEEEEGEIIIIPFQDKVIGEKRIAATRAGIDEALQYVKNFKNEDITYTNICQAWEYSFDKINVKDKNFIYLLTDGEQSDLSKRNPKWGKDCIYSMVQAYCKLVERAKDTYTFYVSLNTNLHSNLKNSICTSCPENLRCSERTPPSQIIDIQATRANQVINIQDGELSFTQTFDVRGNLSPNFKYDVFLSIPSGQLPKGSEFRLKQDKNLSIENGKTSFSIDLSPAQLKQLQQTAPEEFHAGIYYKKQDLKKLGLADQIIEFTPNKVVLTIRNRKEKTLKIKIID